MLIALAVVEPLTIAGTGIMKIMLSMFERTHEIGPKESPRRRHRLRSGFKVLLEAFLPSALPVPPGVRSRLDRSVSHRVDKNTVPRSISWTVVAVALVVSSGVGCRSVPTG